MSLDKSKEPCSNHEELEVVWSGGELLPPRDQHPNFTWEPPRRRYIKSGKYSKMAGMKCQHSWIFVAATTSDEYPPYWLCSKCGNVSYSDPSASTEGQQGEVK